MKNVSFIIIMALAATGLLATSCNKKDSTIGKDKTIEDSTTEQNGHWETVGEKNFGEGDSKNNIHQFKIAKNNVPYVLFIRGEDCHIKKFENGSWEVLSGKVIPPLNTGNYHGLTFDINNNSTPYMAMLSHNGFEVPYIINYSNTHVSPPVKFPVYRRSLTMAIANDNSIYIGYKTISTSTGNLWKLVLLKYENNEWRSVGPAISSYPNISEESKFELLKDDKGRIHMLTNILPVPGHISLGAEWSAKG